MKINGADPDFHRRDLWDAIQSGDFPEWELGSSSSTTTSPTRFDFDVLDATKIIPEELVPVRRVGRLVLDRVVDNFFAETEQVAFCTQNIVPGVDFTNDPLLQGPQLLVPRHAAEAPRQPELHAPAGERAEVPVRDVPTGRPHGDGQPDVARELRAELVGPDIGGPREDPENRLHVVSRQHESGEKRRVRSETFADHYSQARQFFVSQTPVEQQHITDAFVFELSKVERPDIRARMVREPAATSTRTRRSASPTASDSNRRRRRRSRPARRSRTCRSRRR